MGCGCGVKFIRAADYAAKVVADPANAGKPSSQLARETGLSDQTIGRARRKSDSTNVETDRVTGKDGKSYPATKPKHKQPPVVTRAREIVRPLVDRGEPVTARELAKQHDISADSFERALHVERALHDVIGSVAAPDAIDKARLELFQQRLEADFEQRVLDEVRKRLNEILPKYRADHEHYRQIIERRRGFMDRKTYNGILMRLHPDHGGDADLLDAFVKLKNILLDEKESPTESDLVPRNFEELMERKRKADEKRKRDRQ
jgi:hypothetical protein